MEEGNAASVVGIRTPEQLLGQRGEQHVLEDGSAVGLTVVWRRLDSLS